MNPGTREIVNQNFYRDLYLKEEIPKHQIQLVEFVMEDCKGDMEKIRIKLIDLLFTKIVNDEENFAKNFYLTFDQITEMRDSGMFFGSHGYKHEWLAHLNDNDLDIELNKSLEFLRKIKQNIRIMSYPQGNYNERVISKIEKLDYKIGFTIEVGDAELTKNNAFKLKRYDTNDFPQ